MALSPHVIAVMAVASFDAPLRPSRYLADQSDYRILEEARTTLLEAIDTGPRPALNHAVGILTEAMAMQTSTLEGGPT